jgi:hypothetical protein
MPSEIITLKSGTRIRIKPVPAFTVERIQTLVKMPEPPIFYDEESGRDIVNPTDPQYLAAVQEAETRRIAVSMLAAVIFGTELVDAKGNKIHAPTPEEDDWEAKLSYMGIDWREKLIEDVPMPPGANLDFARDACYLLYTQMENDEIQIIASKTLGGEAYATAVDTFQGTETRGSTRPVRPKRSKPS